MKKIMMTLAAVLCCAMTMSLTSCSQSDNPVDPKPTKPVKMADVVTLNTAPQSFYKLDTKELLPIYIAVNSAYKDARGTVTVARCGQEYACAVGTSETTAFHVVDRRPFRGAIVKQFSELLKRRYLPRFTPFHESHVVGAADDIAEILFFFHILHTLIIPAIPVGVDTGTILI